MPILLTKHNLEYETSFFNEKTRKNKQVTQLNSTQLNRELRTQVSDTSKSAS